VYASLEPIILVLGTQSSAKEGNVGINSSLLTWYVTLHMEQKHKVVSAIFNSRSIVARVYVQDKQKGENESCKLKAERKYAGR
jgi:hypothetical protein